MSAPDWYLREEDNVLHLLECRDCRAQRTLPRRFHIGVVHAYLERTERHGRCRQQPYARELEYAHDVHRFELQCSGWHTGKWTKDVSTSEAAALVRAFVDAALDAQEKQPSPGTATGVG
ncbi:hypothetical protein OIE69_42855 [Actinacidiphila glaucinigra]|uniref:hypothetical protein n=1 Tax=Actinacidiphila glaucinigra TaxID=235986 RepID=UPI002DD7E06B|nr:hypothetical protein [Actinacidiphila glaucinigra]WSD57515.1 hypothetical protein OIE69_00365 [Actinacidiphila glaucinigra]WSD65130.1 hypothetical protein OIE69_42855 [Actinacidiphila glaucinigra]